MLEAISNLVGCSARSNLVNAVKTTLINSNQIWELEAVERRLEAEKWSLQDQVRTQEDRVRDASRRAVDSARAIVHKKEALPIPAEVVNKAKMFDARLGQEDHLSGNKII